MSHKLLEHCVMYSIVKTAYTEHVYEMEWYIEPRVCVYLSVGCILFAYLSIPIYFPLKRDFDKKKWLMNNSWLSSIGFIDLQINSSCFMNYYGKE